MTYTESIRFLYNLQKFGMKFGLRGIRTLLASLGHPEKQFASIHIAGTNGKGSTASMIAAMLTAAGYKTGLYTSPHLVSFNERIRIDGKPISSREVVRLTSQMLREVQLHNNTFFEVVTAMAFMYFADAKVDIAVVETGLGGRLDATNVLKPIISVITTIGLEHTQILGTSLEKIAFEKGGIIKEGIPCITGVKSQKAVDVLTKICKKNKSQLVRVHSRDIHIRRSSLDGLLADFCVAGEKLSKVRVALAGRHQAMNALLALQTIKIAAQQSEFTVDEKAIREGLLHIQHYSGIQARLSIVRKNPLVIADVAHNPDAVHALCASLRNMQLSRFHIVFGLMQDKNLTSILSALGQIAEHVFVVQARTERSRTSAELAQGFRRAGVTVEEFQSVKGGVSSALHQHDGVPVLITGSHFVVGEAIAFLKKEKYLTINQ